MNDTLTVVLGGGRGNRLMPLTAMRAKPAVPLGGKYRLIDIPISNAIHSGLRRIYVLTQFNSASLNSHITKTYRFDAFSNGWVDVLAAEQTNRSADWYQGTADAIRQQLDQITKRWVRKVLILSGDHLYRMDYSKLVRRHEEAGADVTVSCIPVTRKGCSGFGVLRSNDQGFLEGFKEKPRDDEDISALETPPSLRTAWAMGDKPFLASMGVYVFSREALVELLSERAHIDFGQHVIPAALRSRRVAAYLFDGYWEDIGTIEAFFNANLAMCGEDPPFLFGDEEWPIFTRPRFLPASKFLDANISRSLVADGCVLFGATVKNSVIGLRSRLFKGCSVEDSIIMGADYLETPEQRRKLLAEGVLPVGIGEGSSIRRAIIDKNARIGPGCVIHGSPDRREEDHGHWAVREGIVVVGKSATIPAGTTL
jgi:glucose-1-phosphate adenylyltransferase